MGGVSERRAEGLFAGRYRLERRLGGGPVGVVAEATRAEDGRRFAIKSLDHQFVGAENVARRFVRALVDASRLRSAHAARVFEVGSNGLPFAELELLDGPSLERVVRDRGPLAVADAAHYAMQACEALAEAHALGFIHGNLKLENWFIEPSDDGPSIKLTDFGGSRTALTGFAFADPDMELVPFDLPRYEAPERILTPRDSDPRSDVWSVGVALYVMLTGRFPFDGDTVADLCAAVAGGTFTDLGRYRPDVACGLVRAIQRCLERDPGRRFQSATELALALMPFAGVVRLEVEPRRNGETPTAFVMHTGSGARFTSSPPVALDVEAPQPHHAEAERSSPAAHLRQGHHAPRGGLRPVVATAIACVMLATVAALITGWWMSGFTSLSSSFASTATVLPSPQPARATHIVSTARPMIRLSDACVAKAAVELHIEPRSAARRAPSGTPRGIPDVGF